MQDESVQLRPVNDSLLAEQKAGMERFAIDTQKQAQRERELKFIREQGVPENVFARPVKRPESSVIDRLAAKELEDRMARREVEQGFETTANVPVPASFYQELKGKSVVRDLLGVDEDTAETLYLNNYVLQKMRTGKMQDTKENFEKVFNRLLARNDLGRNQRPDYIIQKLYLYLSKKDIDEEDDLVRSLISKHRGRRHGRR